MKIGFSLPVSYLGDCFQTEDDQLWYDIFGSPQDGLQQLKKLGVTVHGWLPSINGESFLKIVEGLNHSLKGANYQDVALVVHGHSILDTTLIALERFGQELAQQGSPLIFALEICRAKEGGPVGRTYREILFILGELEFKQLGICWDLGHTQANGEGKPNFDFAKKVIHTHIHDLGSDGRTHFPVTEKQGYVAKGVQLLKDRDYDGVYNLELYPTRWNISAERCGELLETSITTLRSLG